MLKGYGGGGDARPAGLRERPLPRVPARSSRPRPRARTSGAGATRCSSRGRGTVPEQVRSGYAQVYREMLAAGYTAVGEFHYLGLPEAHAAVEAAAEAGIEFVLLLAAYGRGGLERFRQDSPADYLAQLEAFRATGVRVGLAPHSVRACPRDWLEELGALCGGRVAAAARPRRRAAARDRGVPRRARPPPIELLAETGCLGPHATVVHATHADARELDLLAEAGARVCLCPTTEANLGDGFAPVEELCERGIGICIGSDSNVRIDPLEELRELEGIARRRAGRRNVVAVSSLLCFGATRAPRPSGSNAGPTPRSTSSTLRWRGSRRRMSMRPRLRLRRGRLHVNRKPCCPALFESGRRDLNSGPLVPQTSALTRLRHAPSA